MSRIALLAATAALAISLSPLAQAGTTSARSAVVAAQEGSGEALSAITIRSLDRFHDYTGMAPSMIGAEGPQWTAAMAHDYDGDGATPTPAMLGATPSWNLSMAHDYTGD